MKVLSLLLMLIVSGLSLVPCCDAVIQPDKEKKAATSCCASESCESEKQETGRPASGSGDCSSCSPFFVCGTCTGFVFHVTHFSLSAIAVPITTSHSRYVEFIDSEYFNRQWQPPRIA